MEEVNAAVVVGAYARHHRHLTEGGCSNIGRVRRIDSIKENGDIRVKLSPFRGGTWNVGDFEILPPEEVAFYILAGEEDEG